MTNVQNYKGVVIFGRQVGGREYQGSAVHYNMSHVSFTVYNTDSTENNQKFCDSKLELFPCTHADTVRFENATNGLINVSMLLNI